METAEALKQQIKSTEDLRSVVKTMKSLAAVSIRQYERAVESLAHYRRATEMGLQVVLRDRPALTIANPPASADGLGIILLGSEQGMCGQFNEQVAAHMLETVQALAYDPDQVRVVVVGERVLPPLEEAGQSVQEVFATPGSTAGITPLVQELVLQLEQWRSQHQVHRIWLVHNRPLGRSTYRPHRHLLLPLDQNWLQGLQRRPWPSHILPTYQMGWQELFSALLRQYFFVSLYQACAESLASENASRLAAMQTAEKNIEEQLTQLQQTFHQQRQSAITAEILDIVAGLETLTQRAD